MNSAVESTRRNIDKVIERGGQLDSLLKKAEGLNIGTKKMRSAARVVNRKIWKQKIKSYGTVFVIVAVGTT